MATEPFQTADDLGFPTVRQLSVFLENRLGQLLRLAKLFEQTDIHILGLSVVNAIDCAVIRLIVNNPDEATQVLQAGGFAVSNTELIVVLLPPGSRGLLTVYTAIVTAEVNVQYTYPLLVHPKGRPAIALQVDNLEMAARTLAARQFEVVDETDLQTGP